MNPSTVPLGPFNMLDDNIGSRWEKWLNRFENYLVAMAIEDPARQTALLLHYAGEEVHDLYLTLPESTLDPVEQPPPSSYVVAKRKLNKYFHPRVNREFEIFKFRQCKQESHETTDQFYAKLLKLSKTCNFDNPTEEIKSQIILNTIHTDLRKYGLTEQPNLDDVLTRGRTIESTAKQLTAIEERHNGTHQQCNKLKYNNKNKHFPRQHQAPSTQREQPQQKCKNCGSMWHPEGRNACPALKVHCRNCNKLGHFARVCMSTTKQQGQKQKPNINFNSVNTLSDSSETSLQLTTPHVTNKINIPTTTVKLNGISVNVVIDTGSSVNIINNHVFQQLGTQTLIPTATSILPYNTTTKLEVLGKFLGTYSHNNHVTVSEVFVVNGLGESLISYETSMKLKLVQLTLQTSTRNSILDKYPNICKGIGQLKHHTVKLHIDTLVPPVANKHRRIPFHLRKSVETELKRLEDQDIIEKAVGPTPWVSPVVVVPKPHNPDVIRLCVDMREANKAIKRERHPTPTIDEIITELNGSTIFSKIDLKDGYHQLLLDEESRYITVFSTHVGLYRYKRLSFGINSAAEIFQNTIRQLLHDIPGVLNVSDDIIIYGKTVSEHDQALTATLKRLNENNLTLNAHKCIFKTNTIKFFGYVFSHEGIYPDPSKVQSITNLESPQNVHELRSFLGMLNYVQKFLPNLASNTQVLRELLNKNKSWDWTTKHQEAFEFLKAQLSNAHKLAYFDTTKHCHVHVDAGPTGLGAILSQVSNNNTEIVAFASRTLTPTEQRYSQIEKETLAAVWAIRHFHIYLFGTNFTLHTDHKPLVSIFNNPRSAPSPRIERLCLKLQPYVFTVQHQQGSTNPSDYLSRHPQIQTCDELSNQVEVYIRFITEHTIPKALSLKELQEHTARDTTLTLLKQAIVSDPTLFWKNSALQPFKMIKDELTVYEGVILRANRIVVPASLYIPVIQLAHQGHLGIVKTTQLLRTKLWFPKLGELVKNYIQTCLPCQAVTPYKQRSPIMTHKTPDYPFQRVDVDFAGPFPNVSSTNFKSLQKILDRTFALFGFPEHFQSDNGPPFNGNELKNYLSNRNIKQHLVTPLWPEANGLPERFIKTLKKSLLCSFLETSDMESQLHAFLINYRSVPHSTTKMSPYQLVFHREVRNFLPQIPSTKPAKTEYNPETEENNRRNQNDKANQRRQTKPHNLQLGQKVLCKQRKLNTLTPVYDPKPFIITRITGSQIEAWRQEDNKTVLRNSSYFKPFATHKPFSNIPIKTPSLNSAHPQPTSSPSNAPTTAPSSTSPHPSDQHSDNRNEENSQETSSPSPSSGSNSQTPRAPVSPKHQTPSSQHLSKSPSSKPQSTRPTRQRRPPKKLEDYFV